MIRAEYKRFDPISLLNLNSVNKKTTFTIHESDLFMQLDGAKFYISGEYLHSDGKTQYGAKANVKMVDNFPAFLWEQIRVKMHESTIDSIESVGHLSTIKGVTDYIKNDTGITISCGFKSNFTGGGDFEATGALSNFGLGIFEDVSEPLFNPKLEIEFIRNSDNNVLFRWKSKKADGSYDVTTLPNVGKVIIKEFYLLMPIITFDNETKVKLIEQSVAKPYDLNFKSWQCVSIRNFGTTIDLSNLYNGIRPLFVMVSFQTNRDDNQEINNSNFDHCKLKEIWVEIDGNKYPDEPIETDFDDNKYFTQFNNVMNFKRVFQSKSTDLFYDDPARFKTERPIFVIDTSVHPENISNSKSKIILHSKFKNQIPANTICYVCFVSDVRYEYEVITKKVIEK